MILAALGFFIPQKVPLEYYSLQHPGEGINYLEISCAADKAGDVQIFHDLTRGINELDSIRVPLLASKEVYTYTFPLPDAPASELRLDPPGRGTALFIQQMRVINRRREEIRRFTRNDFEPLNQIASISPTSEGWTVVSTPDATDPFVRISLAAPFVPAGMNHRNLLRCLLSTGYLSMMIWILLLAIFFAFYRPNGWSTLFSRAGFLAFLAIIFAIVGNRGLIRNSIHYANFVAPPLEPGLRLEFDLATSSPSNTQLFWDTGEGISEENSARRDYETHTGLQTVRFPLPDQPIKMLRFDPREGGGQLKIRGIRVTDTGDHTRAVLPLDSFVAEHDIDRLHVEDNWLNVEIPAKATDPILHLKPEQVAEINRLQNR